MSSTARLPTAQRMTELGWLKGEAKIPAPRSGGPGRGRQGGEQGTGEKWPWHERKRRDFRRMDGLIERRVCWLTIVANQATLNLSGIKNQCIMVMNSMGQEIWAGQRGCLSSMISEPQQVRLEGGTVIIWRLLHSLVPKLEWFKGWAQLGLSPQVPTSGLSMWPGPPCSMETWGQLNLLHGAHGNRVVTGVPEQVCCSTRW